MSKPLKLNKCAGCDGKLYDDTFAVRQWEGRLVLLCPLCTFLSDTITLEIKKMEGSNANCGTKLVA